MQDKCIGGKQTLIKSDYWPYSIALQEEREHLFSYYATRPTHKKSLASQLKWHTALFHTLCVNSRSKTILTMDIMIQIETLILTVKQKWRRDTLTHDLTISPSYFTVHLLLTSRWRVKSCDVSSDWLNNTKISCLLVRLVSIMKQCQSR